MAVVETEKRIVRAQAKYVHSSARKARLVTDLIRGRSVPEARTILVFTQRAAAIEIEKAFADAFLKQVTDKTYDAAPVVAATKAKITEVLAAQ